MKKYTYINTFHDTSYRSEYSPAEIRIIEERIWSGLATTAEKSLRKNMYRKLCGISDCLCGDYFGRRG